MSKEIVLEWLQETANTLFKKDIKGHLNLISKDISLTGIPGYENIDYGPPQTVMNLLLTFLK